MLRKFCVLILLLDFVLTTEVELSFCLVEEIIYIYTVTDQRVGKNTRGGAIKLLVSF